MPPPFVCRPAGPSASSDAGSEAPPPHRDKGTAPAARPSPATGNAQRLPPPPDRSAGADAASAPAQACAQLCRSRSAPAIRSTSPACSPPSRGSRPGAGERTMKNKLPRTGTPRKTKVPSAAVRDSGPGSRPGGNCMNSLSGSPSRVHDQLRGLTVAWAMGWPEASTTRPRYSPTSTSLMAILS